MKARIDYTNVPEALRGMYQLEHYIHNSGLEESLVHLVKTHASQINGCAYCLDLHSKDARALRETEQRLYVLDAREEAPYYSEQERAALSRCALSWATINRHVDFDECSKSRGALHHACLLRITS